MDYLIKHFNFNKKFIGLKGFSLIELLVVIGIFTILFSISTVVFNNSKSHSNLEVGVNSVVEALRFSQSNAQSGKEDSKWGVEIFSDKMVIFKGNTYTGRDVSFDEILSFPGGINGSGLSEIVFEKLTGNTSTTGSVILSNDAETKNININEKGTITY